MSKKIENPITDIKAVDNKNIKYAIPKAITDVGRDWLKCVFVILVR
ncbi:MAG TPA: hypothetical protein GXX75_20105 [Clostridiales bacterium]|nr:hypothetical protein [Clostridiales bacterium]